MKASLLDKDMFDHIFKELVEENRTIMRAFVILNTFDIARKLWSKHRIPYKAQAELVRKKMREWWNSYEWRKEPLFHKMICGYAVNLAQPMGHDYCILERRGLSSYSLISVYPFRQQKDFSEKKTKHD